MKIFPLSTCSFKSVQNTKTNNQVINRSILPIETPASRVIDEFV